MNSSTAFSGQITLTCTGNETAPIGGFVIQFTGTTTGTNNVIIDGASTTVTAANLTATAAGVKTDAIFKIIGSDYVTIKNFTMTENAANTTGGTAALQKMTEWGVGLFAASVTNGAQYNTIENNIITLSSATKYQNAIGVFSNTATSVTNSAQTPTSAAGTNSYNMIYGNTISGVQYGVYFLSIPQTATVYEVGNDIGGSSLSTANTITYGCSNTASDLAYTSYSGAVTAGVYFRNVVGNSVRYNTITNVSTLTLASGGIFSAVGTSPTGVPAYTSNFSNNTITITQTSTTAITGIDFGSGSTTSTGTITANNNRIVINHTSTTTNSAADAGIKANYPSASSTINFNTVIFNTTFNVATALSYTGTITGILLPTGTTGTPTMTAIGDSVTVYRTITVPAAITGTFSGAIIGISGVTGASTFQIGNTGAGNGNIITFYETPSVTGTSTFSASQIGISLAGATGISTLNIQNNIIGSGVFKNYGTGTFNGINHGSTLSGGALNVSNNTINVDRSLANSTGTFTGITSPSSTITMPGGYTINNNTITFVGSALLLTGTVSGIINTDGTTGTTVDKTIYNNNITLSGVMATAAGINFAYGNTNNVYNNTISINASVSSTQVATINGILSAGTVTTIANIYSNTFTALNAVGTSSGTINIFAINASGGSGTTNIYDHTITNISSGAGTGIANIGGISVSGGATVATNIFRNKVYDLSMSNTNISSITSLIRISVGTNINVYNNLLSQTNALTGATGGIFYSNNFPIVGINITSTTALSNVNVYYNTVYLSSTSTGANFGGVGIYHVSNATATTSVLNLRNNIIYNDITPTGSGKSFGMRRTLPTLNNYATTSNNNLFKGASGIYTDSINVDATIANFKT